MKPQFSNFLTNSTILWLDNLLLEKGQAFYNVNTRFYPVNNKYNNYYVYAAPYKQFAYDSNTSGVTVPTGLYVNSVFVGTGVSGFAGFNFNEGLAYFTSQLPANTIVSGAYSAKEVNVKLVSEPEEMTLLEKKYYKSNQLTSTVSGNLTNEEPFPIIYLRSDAYENEEFAFGGEECSKRWIRFTILSDSAYQVDAIKDLITDRVRGYIPLYDITEMPFDNLGRLRGNNFNFSGDYCGKIGSGISAFINSTRTISFNSQLMAELKKANPVVFPTIIEIETYSYRFPRD